MNKNIAVIGASGAIGNAFVEHYSNDQSVNTVYAFSRNKQSYENKKIQSYELEIENQKSIQDAAEKIKENRLSHIIVATGILHSESFGPEKSIKDINHESMTKVMSVNTIGPSLIGRYFIPLLTKDTKSVLAFLSARVGSISDNKLGGWYAYRASKTALNQIIKNFSIEVKRTNPDAIFVGLQPGTVKSYLSKPFEKNVKDNKLFTPDYSAKKLLEVIAKLEIKDTGKIFAWNGEEIQP